MPTDQQLLSAYDAFRPTYDAFVERLTALLEELLAVEGLRLLSISGRVKDRDSVMRKIAAGGGKYESILDITDIAGLRVIAYFADDVDKIGRVVRREFDVIEQHSVDKRAVLPAEQFGYLSLHEVIQLSSHRSAQFGNERFQSLRAEIQIRSVLQHAWAEIEHDLGYKAEVTLSRDIRREFARIASLLETADNAFIAIRDELVHERSAMLCRVRGEPALALDNESLHVFIEINEVLADLNARIAKLGGGIFKVDDDVVRRHVVQLSVVSIRTIGELEVALGAQATRIERFAAIWSKRRGGLHSEILPIVYLEYLLVVDSQDPVTVRDFLNVAPTAYRNDFIDDLMKAVHESDR